MNFIEDAFEAACAGPLLSDKGNDESAIDFRGINAMQEFYESDVAKAVADGCAGLEIRAEIVERAVDDHGTEIVGAETFGVGGGSCADVDEHIFNVVGIRRIQTAGLQVNGKAADDAGNPFAGSGLDLHGLGGIEFVEEREDAALREALDLKIAVGGDVADDVAGFVHGGNDEANGAAAAESDDDVAEIVRLYIQLGRDIFQAVANFCGECEFVSGNRRSFDEVAHNSVVKATA